MAGAWGREEGTRSWGSMGTEVQFTQSESCRQMVVVTARQSEWTDTTELHTL